VSTRQNVADKCVVMVGSSLPEHAAIARVLQEGGARTIEFYHGAGVETWVGASEGQTEFRSLFIQSDAETVSALGQKCIVGGMPQRVTPNPARPAGPRRLLILTNYVHRDFEAEGRHRYEPFQNEILDIAPKLRAQRDVLVRWRPHPADNPERVRKALERHPEIERSPSRALEEDLGWCDLVVTTMSTALVEALFAGVPIFKHVLPEFRDGPNCRCYDPSRVFLWSDEVVPRIVDVVDALVRGDDVLGPERREREALFGPGGRPQSLGEALRREGLLRPAKHRGLNGAREERP
jgi:hypothetical protein